MRQKVAAFYGHPDDEDFAEAQGRARALARARGWRMRREPRGDGRWSRKRTSLRRLRREVAEGRIDVLVAPRLQDLADAPLGFYRLAREVEEAGADLVALDGAIDTTRDRGAFLLMRAVGEIHRRAWTESAEAARRVYRPGPGRPRKEVDVEGARRLIEAGATVREAAQQIGTSPATLYRRLAA